MTNKVLKIIEALDNIFATIGPTLTKLTNISNQIKSNILFYVQPDKILAVKIT